MSATQRKTAIPKPESVPDLRDALTADQREAIRRAAQAERHRVECVGSGVRCVTDDKTHVGTFVDQDAAHDAAEDHEHAARVADMEWAYTVACLECDLVRVMAGPGDARVLWRDHWLDEQHFAVWDRAPELVDAIEEVARDGR
jgi:hypothetical protein